MVLEKIVVNNGESLRSSRRFKSLFLSSPYPGDQKFSGQPTGLLYSLSVLADRKEREYGNREDVKEELEVWSPEGVIDYDNSEFREELSDYLDQEKPKLVGISTFSVSYQNAKKIKDTIKDISPETVVVFGGAHEDNFVNHYRKKGSIDTDFVVAGDGAHILDELYKLVEENPEATVDEIKEKITEERFGQLDGAGILLYNKDEELKEVFSQSYISDSTKRNPIRLDQLPTSPRYLLKDEEESASGFDIFDNNKTAQVMVGQGCPFGCGFCSEGIKKTWFDEDSPRSVNPAREISNVDEELKELSERGYRSIFFDDSTFFAKSKNYMRDLIRLMNKYDFEWGCQTTQNSIHQMKDLLPEMRESGLKYLYMGVEHYDGQIRDSFGKSIGGGNKFNGYSIEDTLDILKENDIDTGMSITFGHPDQESDDEKTKESKTTVNYVVDRTAELIEEFPNIQGVSLNIITYHPGTPISVRYEQKGGEIDYTGHPNKQEPFTEFEEGIGPHPNGMDSGLANHILEYAKERIGDKLWV